MRGMEGPIKPPLIPVLAGMVWLGLGLYVVTKGARPVPGKLGALTLITIVSTVCHYALWRHYKTHALYIKNKQLSLTDSHTWGMLGVVVCYLAIGAWAFT